MGVIAITGCPATGKTLVGKLLAKTLNVPHIDYAEYLLSRGAGKIEEGEIVLNEELAKKELNLIKEGVLTGTYILDYITPENVSVAYVLRCNPKVLFYRYLIRDYSLEKIRENLTAEYLDYCLRITLEKLGYEKVNQIDATLDPPEILANRIYDYYIHKKYVFESVDWLSTVSRPFDLLLMK